MRHPSAKKVASAYHHKHSAKKATGKALRFLMEAAAGAKPLIDVDAMTDALEVLGWEVTPSVEGKVVEGRSSWIANQQTLEVLKKTPGYVLLRASEEATADEWATSLPGGTMARFSVIAQDQKVLGVLRKSLDKLSRTSRPGEMGVTVSREFQMRGRAPAVWMGKPGFQVTAWVNVNVWSIKNLKAKGTARKPVTFAQKFNANLKLESTSSVKAGQLWNGLYSRGLQADAAAYLAAQGEALPSVEDLDTPEEKIKRRFDQEVKKALLSFTDKQFDAVVKNYNAYYTRLLDEFLDAQEKAFAEWTVLDDKLRAEGKGGARDFTMAGSYKDPTRWKQDLPQIRSLLVKDDERSKYRAHVYKKVSGVAAAISKLAKDVVTQIRDGFVQKNTMKLSAIVTGKGNLESIEVLRWARSNFEGEILFKFKDGSSFQVRNKTVTKMSNRGTWFSQYPTTFHAVLMPDGKKMSGPSEARMITVFAVA